MGSKKVLIAVSSYCSPFYSDGKKTGVFVVEALHPFLEYSENGFDVDIVSETGKFGWDEHSLSDDFLNGKDKEIFNDKGSKFIQSMHNVKMAKDVDSKEYCIFFASAGHSTLFDYPKAEGLQKIALDIYKNGGVIAAVCHGPVIFKGLIDRETGENIAKGKSLTGFTDEGEKVLQVDGIMKDKNLDSVEDVFKECGIKYLAPIGPWDNYSITDGRIVTGVNPASAKDTAKRSICALEK